MVRCLTGAKFNMKATILHQASDVTELPGDEFPEGEFVETQDELTGQIIKVWQPKLVRPDNPNTPENEAIEVVDCLARGVNYRSGSDEKFGERYSAMDTVNLWVPSGISITRRDRVTNISTRDGVLLWTDENYPGKNKAIVFNVVGVTPISDPFGRHVENYAILERAEVG